MRGSIERCRVATEEIPRHQHLQRALLPLRLGGDALHGPFLHDMEILGGGIAFVEDVVIFGLRRRWPQVLEH